MNLNLMSYLVMMFLRNQQSEMNMQVPQLKYLSYMVQLFVLKLYLLITKNSPIMKSKIDVSIISNSLGPELYGVTDMTS